MKKHLNRRPDGRRLTPPQKTGAGGLASGSVRSFLFRADGQPERLLTLKDLATIFGVHPKTVARWLRRLPVHRLTITARTARYSTATLTALAGLAGAMAPDRRQRTYDR